MANRTKNIKFKLNKLEIEAAVVDTGTAFYVTFDGDDVYITDHTTLNTIKHDIDWKFTRDAEIDAAATKIRDAATDLFRKRKWWSIIATSK